MKTTGTEVYKNLGGGSFESVWTQPGIPGDVTAVDWSDFDADGDLDFVISNSDEPNAVYRNDGSSFFSLAYTSVYDEPTADIAWADIDGDGDPDFLEGATGYFNRIYRNDGFIVKVQTETRSADMMGELLEDLPAGIASVMSDRNSQNVRFRPYEDTAFFRERRVILGRAAKVIEIDL